MRESDWSSDVCSSDLHFPLIWPFRTHPCTQNRQIPPSRALSSFYKLISCQNGQFCASRSRPKFCPGQFRPGLYHFGGFGRSGLTGDIRLGQFQAEIQIGPRLTISEPFSQGKGPFSFIFDTESNVNVINYGMPHCMRPPLVKCRRFSTV